MKLSKSALIKYCISLGFVSLGLAFGGCGGSNDTQTVSPASSGKRGETCLSRNDCSAGLACISGICSKNDFPTLEPNVKECVPVQCEKTADCCGDRPTEAPSKCNAVESVCYTPYIDSCYNGGYHGSTCTASAQCGGGACVPSAYGTCNGGVQDAYSCTTVADCPTDTCNTVSGYCTYSTTYACTADTDCPYYSYGTTSTCDITGTCDCSNPDYDTSADICTDEDCELPVCTLTCDDNKMCAEKGLDCEVNLDCAGSIVTPVCNDDGRCVQCTDDKDCDSDSKCNADFQCVKPCKHDEECPFLNECDVDSGECKEVGCKSDLQCVYWFSNFDGEGGVADPREAKCVTVEGFDHKQCRIPCEVDAECGSQSVCDGGVCTFIGCTNDDECRGAHPNVQTPNDETPYVTHWECQAPKK